jgi:signal transduction histidine kinase
MDLHDGIIQSIYAIGLMLEDGEHSIRTKPEAAESRIEGAIHGLNDVIRDIRNYILNLRPERFQGRDLKRGLEELARDLRANTFLSVSVHADGVDTPTLAPEQTVEILHIAQEALTNVRKHGRATNVDVSLRVDDGALQLEIADNGIGFDPRRAHAGQGLANMRERARALGGDVEIEPRAAGGTRVEVRIPLRGE